MTTIGTTSNDPVLASLGLAATQKDKNTKSLGQEDFLALMIQQLKNQDPMKPMEDGQFIGQMAQFSTVSGIADMTKSVAKLTDAFNSGQALQAASMVGRTILTEGDTGAMGPGKPLVGAVDLPYNTAAAKVRIFNSSGALVREFALGPQQAGLQNFSWDGTLANGTTAPAGLYKFSASIESGSESTALTTNVASRVESVTLAGDGSGSQLRTDSGTTVSLSQIKAVI